MSIVQPQGFYETVRLEMWLRNYSHKTMKSYLSCLRNFVDDMQQKRTRDVSDDEPNLCATEFQELAGHASSKKTEIYTHVSRKT